MDKTPEQIKKAMDDYQPGRRSEPVPQTNHSRRFLAIKMLDDWLKAEITARAFERYVVDRPHVVNARNVCRVEADNLLEEILMLMGVDDTPAAELGLEDDEPQVDPDPRDTEGDLRFHDPEGKA